MFPDLHRRCEALALTFPAIPEPRKKILQSLAAYIRDRRSAGQTARLVAICTHNSRRSHLAQIWLAVAADYYDIGEIATFSGGTEATAFHPHAVDALRRAGVSIERDEVNAANPRYRVRWDADATPYLAFSKAYDAPPNPVRDFAAIMVCTQADAGCPVVTGSGLRLSLPYEDPKWSDGSGREAAVYDASCAEIGREMLYALSRVAVTA